MSRALSRARSRRRSRLRATAVPVVRGIANPTHGGITNGSGRNEHHNVSARNRTPCRRTRTNASRSRSEWIKPTDADVPWRGATGRPRVHRGSASGRETRASSTDVDCWVDTCASSELRTKTGNLERLRRDSDPSQPSRRVCRGHHRTTTRPLLWTALLFIPAPGSPVRHERREQHRCKLPTGGPQRNLWCLSRQDTPVFGA